MTIYCDGACHPYNPGGYACWAWMASSGEQDYGCIGYGDGMTNNVAEYEAVIHALRWANDNSKRGFTVKTDSKLVVKQSTGKWAVNAEHLKAKVAEVQLLMKQVCAKIKWIPREANQKADALARRAFREAIGQECNAPKTWKSRPATDKQLYWLYKLGHRQLNLTRAEASQVLAQLFKEE